MRKTFFLWLLLVVAAGPSRAQQTAASATAAPPKRILFVGNSFTHGRYLPVRTYNAAAIIDENIGLPADDPRAFQPNGETGPYGGIPGIFKKLADEYGQNYEVHIEAVSAKNLAFHYDHALSVIAQPGWDAVVLQGYSTEPLPADHHGKPEDFRANVVLLEEAIHRASPRARIYLEQTWARADLTYPERSSYYGQSIHAMTQDLRHGIHQAEDAEAGPGIVPIMVGDAWEAAIAQGVAQENPYLPAEPGKIDLWGPDNYHPSIYGAYLTAIKLFTEIAMVSRTELHADEQAAHDLGISPVDAARLQRFGAIVTDLGPSRTARQ